MLHRAFGHTKEEMLDDRMSGCPRLQCLSCGESIQANNLGFIIAFG